MKKSPEPRQRPKGTGGIRNRGNERHPRWSAYFTVNIDGKRRQICSEPFERKKDAEAWLAKELGRARTGTAVIPDRKVTVGQLADEWLGAKRHGWEPTSLANATSLVEKRIKPTVGERRVVELRPIHIVQAIDALRNGLPGRRPLSETSLQHTYGALRSILDLAVAQRLIPSNPIEHVERPRRQRTQLAVWSSRELASFLDSVIDDRLYPLLRLASYTGMRRSELLGLIWAAVDLDAGVVSVARRRVRVGYKMVAREGTKTISGSRSVDLDAGTVAVLKSWRADQAEERVVWGSAWAGADNLVFTREDGTPVHADYLTQRFRRLVARAGVPPLRFHDLRHTFATLSLAAGEPAHVVAQRIGHASSAITLAIYAHVLPAQGQQAAARFATLVDDARGQQRGRGRGDAAT